MWIDITVIFAIYYLNLISKHLTTDKFLKTLDNEKF